MNGFVARLGLQEEKLCNNDGTNAIMDGAHQADNSLLKKSRVDIIGSLTPASLFHHNWDVPKVADIAGLQQVDQSSFE